MNTLLQGFIFLQLNYYFCEVFYGGDVPRCKQLINLNPGYRCNYFLLDTFQSHIRIYGNSSIHNGSRESSVEPEKMPRRLGSGRNYINLKAYPVLLTHNLRYKAHFCIEVWSKILLETQSISLKFSTREGGKEDGVYEFEVSHRILMANDIGYEEFISIGCYWHNIIFLAKCELTVNLAVDFLGKDKSQTSTKFYFRLPDWELLNGLVNADPCLFAPFVYVAETDEDDVDEIIIRVTNCSKSVVEIEQRKESSEELIRKDMVHINNFLVNRFNFTSANAPLHFYTAIAKDNEGSTEAILMPILTLLILSIILSLLYIKLNILMSNDAILFLKKKPRVKFQYCKDSCNEVYKKQTETLILYMEKFCNIVTVNDSSKTNETSQSTVPSGETFDVAVLVPFPLTGGDKCDFEQYHKKCRTPYLTKRDHIILELPFWSASSVSFEELYHGSGKWKYFKLMDEFIPFIRYVNRKHCLLQKHFVSNLDIEQMQQKLEECNLTNEGFAFCLEETCSNNKSIREDDLFETECNVFLNLRDMEI